MVDTPDQTNILFTPKTINAEALGTMKIDVINYTNI